MFGKFNVMTLGPHDDILLGFPWLAATEPTIDWSQKAISMSRTKRSRSVE
jgi:hypothetical protein